MMGSGEQTEEEVKYSLVLSQIAEKHGLTSPTTVALAYVLAKAPYVFPIIGGRKVEVCAIS
jgi:aryl-alcohol dehydrogenase-like predicted oxidoreductase